LFVNLVIWNKSVLWCTVRKTSNYRISVWKPERTTPIRIIRCGKGQMQYTHPAPDRETRLALVNLCFWWNLGNFLANLSRRTVSLRLEWAFHATENR